MMHPIHDRTWAAAYHILFDEAGEGCVLEQKELQQDAALLAMLGRFAESVQSPALQVTGSLFIKRYALLIAGALHGFIRNQVALDVSLDRMKLVWKEPVLQFVVESEEQPACVIGIEDEKERRSSYFRHLFADQVVPMLSRVSQVTKIDEDTLWGTVSYSLAYWKEQWLNSELTAGERAHIETCFAELMDADGKTQFAGKDMNPLTAAFRRVNNPWDDKTVLVRSKCCLFYCLPGKKEGHCYTCPKISDELRLDKYAQAHGYGNRPEPLTASAKS
ncbi:IucA/IucC family C-terminal-domain containing protein [Paenibacillus rigui]|uniref:Uncharacterized protein n=1 Tax=Paenibacillus rigui TaxID=554312 RepID=A0A229ULL9_9BACL|nr:IucA/IucC family C-terminal-domain containing protein [Paenibacillus rigui]OXM84185.1 hypothetical protein CF651_22400 [Paenibacillus rigui]